MEKPFVLVADDNEATGTLITALLQSEFAVEVASDGAEAIARLQHRQYAAVLLDLIMPVVDGFGVLDFIREHRPTLLPRVLIVTAALGPRQMQRLRDYEVCGLVPKPFEIDALLSMVRSCAEIEDGTADVCGSFLTSGVILLLADFLRQRLM